VQNNFYCIKPFINLYEKPSIKSGLASQILYGEKFNIIKNYKKFLKIKTHFDKYIGYIEKKNFEKSRVSTHKISVLRSNIYSIPINNKKYKTNNFLPFSSNLHILKKKGQFIEYRKNKWIKKSDIKPLNFKNKKFYKIIKLFLNTKYKWGGKTFKGIDCSALIQSYYKYNNKFFPRDTSDQIRFKKGKKKNNKFKTGDLIFWKGHVALCINSKYLIHAYGPKKKVLIMPIYKTIKIINETAKLKVLKVYSI
tara:strand:- start:982 stop:1734 length:753 start_codon:yes stop_codon:yes gene_type:complete